MLLAANYPYGNNKLNAYIPDSVKRCHFVAIGDVRRYRQNSPWRAHFGLRQYTEGPLQLQDSRISFDTMQSETDCKITEEEVQKLCNRLYQHALDRCLTEGERASQKMVTANQLVLWKILRRFQGESHERLESADRPTGAVPGSDPAARRF